MSRTLGALDPGFTSRMGRLVKHLAKDRIALAKLLKGPFINDVCKLLTLLPHFDWDQSKLPFAFFGCLPLWTSFMYGSKGSVTGGKQDGGGGADDKGHGRCQAGNAVLEICRFVICKSLRVVSVQFHDCLLDCSACSAYQEVSPAQ